MRQEQSRGKVVDASSFLRSPLIRGKGRESVKCELQRMARCLTVRQQFEIAREEVVEWVEARGLGLGGVVKLPQQLGG